MILYLDGKERAFQGDACFGSQSSRRLGGRAVEVVFKRRGWWARVTRRSMLSPNDLILDLTGRQADGKRSERRLILEKQDKQDKQDKQEERKP